MSGRKTHKELSKLLVKAQRGSAKDFEELYKATVNAQYYLAVKIIKDNAVAEDIVQDLYVYLFEHIEDIKNPLTIVAYLNKMNYRMCLKAIGKRKKENYELLEKGESEIIKEIYDQKVIDLVDISLFEVDEDIRDIMIMKYINELRTNEIAETLNVSPRTVQRTLKKGLSQMKVIVKKNINTSFAFTIFFAPYISKILSNSVSQCMPIEMKQRIFQTATDTVGMSVLGLGVTAVSNHMIGSATAIGLPVKVGFGSTALVGVGLASLCLIPPNFKVQLVNPTTEYVIGSSYKIVSDATVKLKEVIVYDDQGKEYLKSYGHDNFELYLTENGKYTVKGIGENDISSSIEIEVNNIDNECPTVQKIIRNDGAIVLLIEDAKSGIQEGSILLTDKNGKAITYEYSKEASELIFELESEVYFSVEDKLGNKISGKIY